MISLASLNPYAGYIKAGAIVLGVLGAIALFWFLVVSPRIELSETKLKADEAVITQLQTSQRQMQTDIASTKQAAAANADAMGNLAALASAADKRTVVVHDAIHQAAVKAGPQPIGAASNAYYDAVIAEQGK